MDNADAKIEAMRVRKILYNLHPLVRYHLMQFCSFGDDVMQEPDAMEAAQSVDWHTQDKADNVDELNMGLSLRPVRIAFTFDSDDDEPPFMPADFEVLADEVCDGS